MNATSVGFATGLMIAAVLLVFIFKFANKDGKVRTEYDERQKIERGKGYTIAFYTLAVYEGLMSLLAIGGYKLPLHEFAIHFTGIVIALTIHCVYCIWKEVYWGLNNDRKRYAMVFAICIVLNAIPIIGGMAAGNLLEDGKIGLPMLNIMVLIMMAVITVTMIIKSVVDKNKETDEEE